MRWSWLGVLLILLGGTASAERAIRRRPLDLGDHEGAGSRSDGAFDAEILDEQGQPLLRVDGYRTVAGPDTVDDGRLAALRSGFHGE